MTMAEEPERPACLGMLVVYDSRKPRAGSGVPAAAQCLWYCEERARVRAEAEAACDAAGMTRLRAERPQEAQAAVVAVALHALCARGRA